MQLGDHPLGSTHRFLKVLEQVVCDRVTLEIRLGFLSNTPRELLGLVFVRMPEAGFAVAEVELTQRFEDHPKAHIELGQIHSQTNGIRLVSSDQTDVCGILHIPFERQ